MKIAILGGGITGLTAGHTLAKKGYQVTLFEKETTLGGLASGFYPPTGGWEWPLERAYHHIFASDSDIINFAQDIGYNDIFFNEPLTASLYDSAGAYSIYPLDTPLDLLRLPLLSLPDKVRAGMVLAFLKFSPYLSLYEKETAEDFLKKYMGKNAWDVLWHELFRKKYGKYAGNILATFIWARLNKRTKKLGYMKGGFQSFVDYLEKVNDENGVLIKKGEGVGGIIKSGQKFVVNNKEYDAVVSTLPTALMTKLTTNIFAQSYRAQFEKLNYLHAVNLIIESKEPLFDREYWVSICSEKTPFMVAVQHTNMIDKKHYGGSHILYVGNYVDRDDKLLKMEKNEVLQYFLPYLKQINPNFHPLQPNFHLFKAPWAQPIFDAEFVKNKPDFETPVKNFFIANLDMTYPYDRGTNYAVKLGKDAASLV